MSTVEKAKEIRETLKKMGINSKQVSVTCDSNSISCRIKDFSVDPNVVSEIANRHESISRCQYSGEILCGGNTYVNVSYDWKKKQELEESEEFSAVVAEVQPKLEALEEGGYGLSLVPGITSFKVNSWFKTFFNLENDGRYCCPNMTVKEVAFEVFVARKLNRKAKEA